MPGITTRRSERAAPRTRKTPDAFRANFDADLDFARRAQFRGRLAAARARLEKTLRRVEAELGSAHPLVAEVLNALGIVGKAEGRFTDAARCYRRALVILRRSRSASPLELADLYHNLGGLEHARGRHAIGEPLARRSVQLRARRHGSNATIVWMDRTAHAALLDGLGRYTESEPVYRRALAVFRRRLGAEDYEVAVTLNNLGCARAALGDPRSAAGFLRKSLIIKEGLFGSTSVEAALTIHNLATAIEDSGRSREAAPLFRRAASLLRRRLGANHPLVRASAVIPQARQRLSGSNVRAQ